MKTNIDQPLIRLVCRDTWGREVAHQTFTDQATAERVMIARNRGEILAGAGSCRWMIETEVES